jgi:hypothetical protein
MGSVELLVQAAQELDRLCVLPAPVAIRNPLPLPAPVIQVDHRGDGIHSRAIHVVLVQPEKSIAPVGIFSLARIGLFVQVCAIEIRQAGFILGEVGPYPIQNHANAALMQMIHQAHKVGRFSEAAGGCKIPRRFIAQRTIERMFGDRKEIDVGEARVVNVIREQRRKLAVRQPAVAALGHSRPRSYMHLIYGKRGIHSVAFHALGHPLAVVPSVAFKIPQARSYLPMARAL